jgi:hypothetical protein
MAKLEELVLELRADAKDLKAQMLAAQKATSDAASKMEAALTEMSDKSGKSMLSLQNITGIALGTLAGGAIQAGLEAVKNAASAMFNVFVTEGVTNAMEAQEAVNDLNNSLARAGIYSKETSSSFKDFAGEMMALTGIGDDNVVQVGSLIQSIGRLKSGEALEGATKAALNLSAALGIDLNTAAMMVGKAAQGEVQSFKRYGLAIEEGATKSDTFANALKRLEVFNGAAASKLGTYSGSLNALKGNFSEVTEEVGDAVVSNNVLVTVYQKLAEFSAQAADFVNQHKDALKVFVGEGIIYAIKSIQVMVDAGDILGESLSWALERATQAALKVGQAFAWVMSKLNSDWEETMNQFGAAAEDAGNRASETFTRETFMGAISSKLSELEGAATTSFQAMVDGATVAAEPVANLAGGVEEVTRKLTEQEEALKSWAEEFAKKGSELEGQQALELELLQAKHEADLISTEEFLAAKRGMLETHHAWELEQLQAAKNQKLIDETELTNAQFAVNKKYEADKLKLQKESKAQEDKLNTEKVAATKGMLGNLGALQSSSNRQFFEIGKAAALSTATIDGIAAVQKALSSAPPPFNFGLAATVGAATAVNIAKIGSTQPPGAANGIDSVPGIGTQDNFPVILAPKERVVPGETNKDLKSFLADSGGLAELLIGVNQRLDRLLQAAGQGTVVQIDGREVFEAVNTQLRAGRRLAS